MGSGEMVDGLMPCGVRGKELFASTGARPAPVPLFLSCRTSDCSKPVPEIVEKIDNVLSFIQGVAHRFFRPLDDASEATRFGDWGIRGDSDERPEWDLLIVGDGELRAGLESSADTPTQSNRVDWLLARRPGSCGLYPFCDVLLLPSDHEPWGWSSPRPQQPEWQSWLRTWSVQPPEFGSRRP